MTARLHVIAAVLPGRNAAGGRGSLLAGASTAHADSFPLALHFRSVVVPLSYIATYVVWQSAFAPGDFWIPQLLAVGDVGKVLSLCAVVPLSMAVLLIGFVQFRRVRRWPVVLRTVLGEVPLVGVASLWILR